MLPDALTVNLLASAATVAVLHTAIGPDHTLPFVMLARARRWNLRRTLVVTGLCGLGHVASSLVLGGVGVALGASTQAFEGLEMTRGDIAAWAMVVFGACYALWGLRHALRRAQQIELHTHDGQAHIHTHASHGHSHLLLRSKHAHSQFQPEHISQLPVSTHTHSAPHADALPQRNATFWTLFLVFVLGPCEPLIALFFLPASEGRWGLAALTGFVFAVATIATMLVLVGAAHLGVKLLPLDRFERWSHGIAGAVIAGSGLAVLYGGL